MAIIKCPECGHDVSSMAAACPNCGYPISGMNLKAPEQPEHAELMEEQAQQNDAFDEFDMIDSEPEQQQKDPSEGKNEKSRGVRPGVVILCIIVLAVTAYAIADIFKTHDKIGGMTSSDRSTSSRSYSSSYSSSRSSGSSFLIPTASPCSSVNALSSSLFRLMRFSCFCFNSSISAFNSRT